MALNLNRSKIGRNILLLAAICSALGAVNFFEPATLAISSLQSKIRTKSVSGDIVVVGIDSPSIREVGRWPWPRNVQGELLRKIDGYNPKAIYIDIGYQGKTTPSADQALRQAIENTQAPTTIIALATEPEDRSVQTIYSHPNAVGSTPSVTAYFPYLFGYVWSLPTSIETERGTIPSVASSIAGLNGRELQNFRIDYGFNPQSIPNFAAKDIFAGTIAPSRIADKIVVLGVTDITQNDVHSMPGWGERPGVLFHVLGAETLKQGFPANWGWLPLFIFALAIGAIHLTRLGLRHSKLLSWSSSIAVLGASSWLTVMHIGHDPLPAIALIGSIGIYVARQKAALIRAQRDETTGFADMTGYMVKEVVSNALFIGASLSRTETKRGYVLDADNLRIMKEVGRRLSTVIDERQLTHNGEQQFLWEMPVIGTNQLHDHLEGLRRLFTEPVVIDGRKIDIDIFFGVDRDVNANIQRRMTSALAASRSARDNNATFKIATSTSFEEHLTRNFGPEFEQAIAAGDATLMLDPEMDLVSRQVYAAGITIKWTHPAYGDIANAQLFRMARETGNLERLSLYLCDQAAAHANDLCRARPGFTVSVKISIDVLISETFQQWMSDQLAKADFRPNRICFNILDLHSLINQATAQSAIRNLQQYGFKVAIGNFGATDTDIQLMTKLKPDAVYLGRGFCSELLGRKSYQIYVDMALRIASASNVETVAEDLEDRDVLIELQKRGCSRATGKIIAIPLTFNDFIASIRAQKDKKLG